MEERTQRNTAVSCKKQEEEAARSGARSAASSRNNFPYMRYFVSNGGFSAYRAAPLRLWYETTPITLSITSIDGRRHIDFTSNQRLLARYS